MDRDGLFTAAVPAAAVSWRLPSSPNWLALKASKPAADSGGGHRAKTVPLKPHLKNCCTHWQYVYWRCGNLWYSS